MCVRGHRALIDQLDTQIKSWRFPLFHHLSAKISKSRHLFWANDIRKLVYLRIILPTNRLVQVIRNNQEMFINFLWKGIIEAHSPMTDCTVLVMTKRAPISASSKHSPSYENSRPQRGVWQEEEKTNCNHCFLQGMQ